LYWRTLSSVSAVISREWSTGYMKLEAWPVEPPGLGSGPLSIWTMSVQPSRARWHARPFPTIPAPTITTRALLGMSLMGARYISSGRTGATDISDNDECRLVLPMGASDDTRRAAVASSGVADEHRSLSERAQPLLEEAAERSRLSARARAERLRDAARAILQATIAAALAWIVATEVVGHSQPFFAPVSAMITLGLTQGERGRRAVEIVLGVTLGIAIADLLVIGLGTGWWQLALVVSLSMAVALLLGSGQLFAQQAAVSAALVATLQPPDGGVSFARGIDALLGGSIALAISALVLPAHPGRIVREAAAPVLAELAAVLEDIADALATRSREAVQAALARGRGIDELARRLDEALVVGRETARLAPPRRRLLGTVDVYAHAATQIDLAVRNVRVLARGARRAIDLDENVPPEVCDALRDLAAAVRALAEAIDDPDRAEAVREPALRAADRATHVLEETGNLSVSVIVGQIRSTAVDLMRGSGMSYDEAAEAVRGAVAEA
jgi:uncharacterized membrane protein YgaE (UPF0421/DUF939 family)